MAKFIFMVEGRGQKGVEIHADLLAEAWEKLHYAIPCAVVTAEPYRIDEASEPPRRVSLQDIIGTDQHRQEVCSDG